LAQAFVKVFAEALGRAGWAEGRNIHIEYRYASGDPSLFRQYAAELVDLAPDAILASTTPALAALRERTRTIPIVFVIVPDPVALGFVKSIAHPGGNITGFASYDAEIIGKWIELLKEADPALARVAIIFNPDTATGQGLDRVIQAAPSLGVTAVRTPVHNDAEIVTAIAAAAREPGGGIVVLPDSFNQTHHAIISDTAIRHRLPLASFTGFDRALIAYWFSGVELHAQAATYIDRILRGASPANLPVQYPTKYQLVINLKTAHALGLTIPPSLLQLADELIE
jgi:putative ABC transport system substrate-binding protein